MINKKAAALTGVLYYLSEEKLEAAGSVNGNSRNNQFNPWLKRARSISTMQNRTLQSRQFSQPYGILRQFQAGISHRPESGRIDKIPELRIRMLNRLAGKRNICSRNQWKSRS